MTVIAGATVAASDNLLADAVGIGLPNFAYFRHTLRIVTSDAASAITVGIYPSVQTTHCQLMAAA